MGQVKLPRMKKCLSFRFQVKEKSANFRRVQKGGKLEEK